MNVNVYGGRFTWRQHKVKLAMLQHTVSGRSVWPYYLYLKRSWAILTAVVAEAEEPAVYSLGEYFVNLDGYSSEGWLKQSFCVLDIWG